MTLHLILQMDSIVRTNYSGKDPHKVVLKMMNEHIKQPIAMEYTLKGYSTRGIPARKAFINTAVYTYMRGILLLL